MFSKKILMLGLATLVMSCATVQQQMGKVVLKFMTKKEADFNNIAVIGGYQTNVAAADVGITTLGTEDWEEGENLVGVQLVKPAGAVGVIALDGTVTVDGQEATSYGGGAYFVRFPAGDNSPKTVTLTSSNGETTNFEISPLPSINITSVNGNSESATIDLNSDLEIELDYDPAAEGKRVNISLITSAVGAKGFANFQSAIIKGKITVPANAFQHKHISGGGPTGKDVTKWMTGVNHLQVSIIEADRNQNGQPFPYFKREMRSFDTVPVNVTGSTEGRAWIRVKGESEEASGKFGYDAFSSNAWYARPLNTDIKRIGISSLSVNGTLFKKESETSESESYMNGYAGYGRYRTITTTTTTFEFPKLDDRYWNQFLENIYADLGNMLTDDYGASLVSVDQITANPIYDEYYTPEDENSKEYIAKNLRNTKRLLPNSLGEVLSDRTTALVADEGTTARLIRDMNMDAFMDVVINYQVAADDDDKIVLLPNVSFRVTGQTQAFDGMSNTWIQGNVRGPGVAFNRSEFSDLNALNRIGQKDVIIKLIKQAISELLAEQEEFGYQTVWKTALEN